MPVKAVPIRMPVELLNIVDLCAKERRTNQSEMLRQLVWQAAEVQVVKLVAEGRISTGYSAELLGVTYYDIYRIAEANRIQLGATEDLAQQSYANQGLLRPRSAIQKDTPISSE